MNKLIGLINFSISNFGPIAVFYGANHFWGLKAAIVATVVWSICELGICKVRNQPISAFFLFSAGITLLFGLIDLYLEKAIFIKYEAAMTSVLVGGYFAASLFGKKTLIQRFAEAQGRIKSEITPDTEYYFRFLTMIWVAYYVLKSVVYTWVAANYSLEQAMAFRGIVGNVSFYVMLFLSMGCAKQIKLVLAQLRLLPSIRAKL